MDPFTRGWGCPERTRSGIERGRQPKMMPGKYRGAACEKADRVSRKGLLGSLLAITMTMTAGFAQTKEDRPPVGSDPMTDVRQLTLEEKASLLGVFSPAIPRLGIAEYVWWNECLHGVARAGNATVFPQAIGLAAMWDDGLLKQIGGTIGTEARAKYQQALREGRHEIYNGLTFWSPNINIARDPRWGRAQETYGEDPFLTSRLGVAFVEGLQGDDPAHLKVAACAKHFAVHSGPERLRRSIDPAPSDEDLYDTYLPAFEALVKEAHVAAVMTSYNALHGKPCTVSPLLHQLLETWRFDGYVVSDCGAVQDLHGGYGVARDAAEAMALALEAGLDLDCGREASAAADAVRRGLIDERLLDRHVARLLEIRRRLGMFDPKNDPYAEIPFSANGAPENSAQSLEAARKSIVLLKNDGVLPLDSSRLKKIAVIGPNADSVPALLGNYAGVPREPVTLLDGLLTAIGGTVDIDYARGCAYVDPPSTGPIPPAAVVPTGENSFEHAVELARAADVVIFAGGLSAELEGEAANNGFTDFDGRDRTRIELPPPQERMLEALQATGRPVVYINLSGSAIAFPWAAEHVNAIIQAWYPGENGGRAVADVVLGHYNPAGRLPVTFYRSTADLPDFADYSMANRTYRYFQGTPLYPFGFGLSYTRFRYDHLKVDRGAAPGGLRVTLDVSNVGDRAGDEVVQLYALAPASSAPREQESLCGFRRIGLEKGETARVVIEVGPAALRRWDRASHAYAVPAGQWTILAAASSADVRLRQVFELSPEHPGEGVAKIGTLSSNSETPSNAVEPR